jgi:hypothetical protein
VLAIAFQNVGVGTYTPAMKIPARFPLVKPLCLIGTGLLLLVCGSPAAGNEPDAPRSEAERLLADTTQPRGAHDFASVGTNCTIILATAGTPPEVQSYARLRLAQSDLADHHPDAAREQYAQIATNLAYPLPQRYEAQECLQELERLAHGLPARDVSASRTRIPAIPRFTTEFFVSPKGDDHQTGDRHHPFASLTRARDAIRQLKSAGPIAGPVAVTLLPGLYSVTATFELTAADSGTESAPIVYRASKPGTAVLYGGTRLDRFVRTTDPAILNRLPAEGHDHVYQCDLKAAGVTDFGTLTERGCFINPPPTLELFFNGEPMTLARWPKTGFVDDHKIVHPGSKKDQQPSVFEYLDDRAARWTHAEDAWLYGYFRHGWADRTLKILSIDPAAKTIACGPYEYDSDAMEPVPWFNHGHIRYFAFNLLEELGAPGEWYLDRGTGILYLYPPADPAKATVEIGQLSVPMATLNHVAHVRLEGVVFDLARTDCLSLRDCDDCLIAGCTIKRFAGEGIAIIGGHRDGILSCDLSCLGRGATEVVGGDRPTLTPAQHFVENCSLHSFGRLDHTYVPGLRMEGVGIRAAHNRFANCPSSAIRFDGNDLVMEYNQVDHAVLESEDQGGMETWGNPTFRGNLLRYNSFAYIGTGTMEGSAGRAGVRLDDAISGTLVFGNIFHHASQSFGAININSGRDNFIDNNIFAECEKGITGQYDAHNDCWQGFGKNPAFIRSDLYLQRYPDLAHVDQEPGLNNAWRNVFWKCGPIFASGGTAAKQKFNSLANLQYADDPGFVAATQGNFRLKPDADVFRQIAFHPIPVDEIGMYRDAYRKTVKQNSAKQVP